MYPPFARLVLIECKGADEKNVHHVAERFAVRLKRLAPQAIILGPAAAVISKIKNNYRWQIIVKAVKTNDPNSASVVQEMSSSADVRRGVQLTVDVDPQGIM
jgi:primosomal protein N' (replication factor Y)